MEKNNWLRGHVTFYQWCWTREAFSSQRGKLANRFADQMPFGVLAALAEKLDSRPGSEAWGLPLAQAALQKEGGARNGHLPVKSEGTMVKGSQQGTQGSRPLPTPS